MPISEKPLFNGILTLLLDKQYHTHVSEWETNYWSPYLELCRKQTYEIQITKKYDETIEKIYVHSRTTATTVARYCEYTADVTELGTVLGTPGSYEPVWDAWVRFTRKFYKVEVNRLKPEYVTQKRKTLV
jgi:hypothetical protein